MYQKAANENILSIRAIKLIQSYRTKHCLEHLSLNDIQYSSQVLQALRDLCLFRYTNNFIIYKYNFKPFQIIAKKKFLLAKKKKLMAHI